MLLPRPSGHPPGLAHWPPRSFCVYYGRWDNPHIAAARAYELIIAHPGKQLEAFNADLVSQLRSGRDGLPGNHDDSLVLAYLSLGEDENPPPGPVELPGRYLDRKRILQSRGFFAMGVDGLPQEEPGSDGIPDRNGAWGSYYVRPMDPGWRQVLEERVNQLAERGVDGFFLDTVDVAPDLQDQMIELIEWLHSRHPELRWVSNRGLDLFARQPARMRNCLDAVVLESWFTRWNWSWGRAEVTPDREQNERLMPLLQGVTRLYLDYLDPQQPDRGSLLAVRAGHQPGFWTHPFLDRLDPGPSTETAVLPDPDFQVSRLADGRVQVNEACEAAINGLPLPGERGPWAVGAASQLRLRRVDRHGNVSREQWVKLEGRPDDWVGDWSARELEGRVQVSWNGGGTARLWLGEQANQLEPSDVAGPSPLVLSGLQDDRLYWLAISRPGGAPDRARPVRPHDASPPPPPQQVEGHRRGAYLTATWAPVKAADLAGYRVYISRPGGPLTIPYTRVGETNLQVRVPPERLELRVTSFDTGNHESQPALTLTLPPP